MLLGKIISVKEDTTGCCPNCNNQITKDTKICIHCDYELKEEDATALVEEIECKLFKGYIWGIIIFGLVFIGAYNYFLE